MDTFRILIIDDDRIDRASHRRMLEKNPDFQVQILEADTAGKGIQLAEDKTIDCILLDYSLPDTDGINATKAIRSKTSAAIIMLTGQGNEHVAVHAIQEGVNDYLIKDELTPKNLSASILNTINKCRLQKQIEFNRELEEKNLIATENLRLKNEFLRNMSHELRTPLVAILGFTQMLHEEDYGPLNNEQKTVLESVITSANGLLQMITHAIDLVEMESRPSEPVFEKTDLSSLIAESITTFTPLAQDKKIRLSSHVENDLTEVYADPVRLKQVIDNYLSNAIKFTPEAGTVQLHIRRESPNTLRLEVEDTGIGIRTEDIQKLFHTFQQIDTSVTRKYGGTGLSLALVKRIVERQGGEVGVKSAPGKGSVFYAIIPFKGAIRTDHKDNRHGNVT